MAKKTHRPPSRVKYNLGHPTISVSVDRQLYDRLKELRTMSGKTLGDVLREGLKTQAPSVRKAYEKGFKAAEWQYAVWFKCSVCGGNLVLTSDKAKEVIAQYMSERGWAVVNQRKWDTF